MTIFCYRHCRCFLPVCLLPFYLCLQCSLPHRSPHTLPAVSSTLTHSPPRRFCTCLASPNCSGGPSAHSSVFSDQRSSSQGWFPRAASAAALGHGFRPAHGLFLLEPTTTGRDREKDGRSGRRERKTGR